MLERLRNTFEFVRTTWDTRGDNLVLAWEVRTGRVPSFDVSLRQFKANSLPLLESLQIRLSEVSYARQRAQLTIQFRAA